MSDGLHDKLVLTYDDLALTDGVGSQLQRILGIYSLSRLLGASYLHTPIHHVDYQGMSVLQDSELDPDFARQFNELFDIESDVEATADFHHLKLRDISIDVVQELEAQYDSGATGGRPSLVHLLLPYGITDHFPECYEVCKAITPFASPVGDDRSLRVAIHVRRGDLVAVASDRILPNTYYVNVARAVSAVLDELHVKYQLELWTEAATRDFVVEPDDNMFQSLDAPMQFGPHLYGLAEFDDLPNLDRHINGTAIASLRALATADVLVMSRSSLSFVSAILNPRGVALYHPFWHEAPASWLPVTPDGEFDRQLFEKALLDVRR